ncbi:hypothetical protein F4820DRAFT_437772 [Hypoxylon rubiginosum]|uniref:Uncharacterized protein n=1 Tax=Hypoxylon rubiginosum TaxID=110542 RepID=A0ACB9YLR6_9PEZI|nr:hypothetical protein F4820DRAFT_437772 [Hypoxylon rubiginosum]
MPRKGSSKVRTGCLTCKVRKVKCDEGKPQCQRCVGTGRRCDGYAPATSSSNLSLHRPRHLFSNVDDVGEKRALQFFCQVAGPFLSGPMDPYFWTHLVMQFSTFEPAVRHTVVAISSLYEQMHSSSPGSGKVRADDRLALRHYNSAIRHLKLMRNEPLVLLVCVLFVCIEFLLGNREAAIQHCKHGVTLLQNVEASYPWTREYISPIFRRLTMFPFFFGVGRMSFPDLLGLDDQIPGSFVSFQDAQYYIDGIVTRTVRLVRWGDDYRLGNKRQSPVPLELLLEQERIRTLLNEWSVRFSNFQNGPSALGGPNEMLCNVSFRYEIAQIWADTAFEYDETTYDKHLEKFRWIVGQAAELSSSRASQHNNPRGTPKFIFEMGFVPLLYYVVIKCRCLATRIHALSLMKTLGVSRENLWEVSLMHAVGRRFVEIEHDTLLDETNEPCSTPRWPNWPPDEMRIRDSTTAPIITVKVDERGRETRGRMAGFFRRTLEGAIYLQTEFVTEAA